MPNVDNPHGFRPLCRNVYGGASKTMPAHKLAANDAAIFIHDAVAKVTAGIKKTPCVTAKAASVTPGTTPIVGVALNYGAALTATDHLLIPATGEVFECQDNNDTDGVSAGNINCNANIELNAGSALTQISGHELDESTIAATATLDVHILGLLDTPNNDFGSFARVMITFSRPANADQSLGVA